MCGNYSREETIQGRKLYEEIWFLSIPERYSSINISVLTWQQLEGTKNNTKEAFEKLVTHQKTS